jgi:pentatricopeptide repeat protein
VETMAAVLSSSPPRHLFFHFPSMPKTSPQPTPPSPFPSLSLFKRKPYHQLHFSAYCTQSLSSPNFLFASESYTHSSSSSPNGEEIFSIDGLFDLLRLSARYGDSQLARAVHSRILKLEEHTHLGNALIAAYIKLGLVSDAFSVLVGLSCPNVVSYTALISGLSKSRREDEAVELFFRMRESGIEPNEYSFVAILTACIRILELQLGLQVHAMVIKVGYLDSVFVSNALMGLYGKCGCLDFVLKLFDEMPHRDTTSWNTVISSVVKECMYDKAFKLFSDMKRNNGFTGDNFTLSILLTACSGSASFMKGQEVHAHAIKMGLEANLSVSNALIGFYTECGSVKDVTSLFEMTPTRDVITWTEMITAYMDFGLVELAVEIFGVMPERNSFSYNALLAGFCRNGKGTRALEFFENMVEDGVELTEFTLTSVLNACGLLMDCKTSEQIHGFILKIGFGSNACIEAALLDMCTRCGRMEDAKKMLSRWSFDEDSSMIRTSMICGYVRNGQPDEAISLFNISQSEGTMVMDEVASTSVLGLCGTVGCQEMGKQIHCHALKTGFLSDLGVGNAVVSMYYKCWNMDDAIKIFTNMPTHDTVSWNGLLAGYLLHRQGDEALAIWSKMKKIGIKPDKVTFVLIISAYRTTSSNLVDDCRSLFLSMKNIYEIEPTSEHYASFVGVLGYWGLLEEAEEMISKMPFEPKASVWRALLDSCRIHSNTTIGKRVAKRILAMEPIDPSTYILVSNLYSASGRWHCSEMVREDMRERGFQKHPGRSWIIYQNKIHSFYARDKSHPQVKDIYSGLEILILECLKAGYVPDTSYVLHEVEEHQKKDFLFYHSAKLAATYGLLTTRPGKPIRILKNIILCGDCHTFLKYVSIITKREIFLRDSSGFHCFSRGHCSCKDYW